MYKKIGIMQLLLVVITSAFATTPSESIPESTTTPPRVPVEMVVVQMALIAEATSSEDPEDREQHYRLLTKQMDKHDARRQKNLMEKYITSNKKHNRPKQKNNSKSGYQQY